MATQLSHEKCVVCHQYFSEWDGDYQGKEFVCYHCQEEKPAPKIDVNRLVEGDCA